jgi:indole-3-glycerol phosphate synthase
MTDVSVQSGDGDFLQGMAASSQARLQARRALTDRAALERLAAAQKTPPPLRLSAEGFDLIAEVKKSSPSAGRLAGDGLSPAAQAVQYAAAGAAAISVLTEPSRFDGSLEDLEQVVATTAAIPVMRKDFLVDPYQVVEARAAGAGGVLLIAGILEPSVLRDMLQTTFELGMFALVEAFDEADLARCVPIMNDEGPAIGNDDTCRMLLGINCRNLRTLEVEFTRFIELAGKLPASLPKALPIVAESGVDSPDKAGQVANAGYRLALVGTALMQSDDPESAGRALLAAGRAAQSR